MGSLSLAYVVQQIWCRDKPWVRDVLHGFKGWERKAFNQMQLLDHGLSIDLEMVIRSYRCNIKRIEFPTTETPRSYGETHFKFWPTGKKLLAYCWYELFRHQ